ncbi:MAG: histidinol dehydrogenase [Melioribacteraceae bacterium]|nr:MAG: histidinol dehydrogenase [Melioribacteraceae bacterium]
MKKVNLKNISKEDYQPLLKRPAIDNEKVFGIVQPILSEIKNEGMNAIIKFAKEYDELKDSDLRVKQKDIDEAEQSIDSDLKQAIKSAIANITKFHEVQFPKDYEIETMKGVKCGRVYRAIENVGLYIPGGTASLFSTLLMLAIPAKITGCKRIVVCSPKPSNEVLYCSQVLGIDEVYDLGGAQAIGFMAYGTEEVKKVDKVFGPGNQFVTAAKSLVSIDPDGCAIDMPAGPSEVIIIADENANPKYAAADLLSQAEHGIDSQVILISTSQKIIDEVELEVIKQLEKLPRKEIAEKALEKSLLLKCDSIENAISFSNNYAPEHLILQIENANSFLKQVQNAGSVFLGNYTPESAGDYASGTNHSLPTYGFAKTFSGVNLLSFMKGITYQSLSKEGIINIGKTVIDMANAEGLKAHANAVEVRLND